MTVYEIITARIVEALNNGVAVWRKPWKNCMPQNAFTGRQYRGVNALLLQSKPFESSLWMTYNQARGICGSVRKGERGTPVIFYLPTDKKQMDGSTRKGFVLRYFTVFNHQQTEGIVLPSTERKQFDPILACENIVAGFANPPKIIYGGNRAFYNPMQDLVQLPHRETFSSEEEYYSTIFHELVHSSGSKNRLNRRGVAELARCASHEYSHEELVSEIGAAFLCAEGGISPATIKNQTAYLNSWAKRLSADPRMIVEAASQATRAVDLILGRGQGRAEESVQEAA